MQRQRPQRAAAVAANAGLSFDGTGPNPAVAPPPQSSVRYNAPDADVDERPVLELPQELEVVKTHIETLLSELGEGEMMTSAEIRDAVLGPGAPWKLTARRGKGSKGRNPPKSNIIMRALLIDWPQAWEAGGALPDSPWAKHDSSRHSRFSANAPEWQDANAEAWNYFEPLVELIVDGNAFVEPTPRNWPRPESYGYKAEDELRCLGSNFTWRDLLAAESIYGSSDREDALIKRSVKEMISCGEAKPSDKATPFFVLPGQGPAFDLTPTQHPNLLKRLAEYKEFAYLREGSYVTALHSKSETVHLGLAVKDPAFEIGSLTGAARRDGVRQPMYSFGFAGMHVTSHSATLSERAEVETETPGVDEDVRVRCWQVDEEVPPELRAASGVGFTLHPSMGFDHKTGKFTIVHLRVGAVASEAAGGVVLKAPELMKFVPTFLGKEDDDAWKSWGNSRVDLEKYSVGNVIFGISMGLGGSHRLVRKYCADAFDSFPWMLVNELYNATDAKELDQFWIWRHWHWAYLDVTIAPAGAALQHDRSGAAHDIVIPKMARCGIPEFGKHSELLQEMKSVKGYGRGGEMKLMLKSKAEAGRETQPKIVACTVAFDMGMEEERSLEAARHRHWIVEEWKRRGGEGWREDRAAFRGAFEAHLVANASANFRVGMIATSDFKKKSDEALWRYVDTKSDVPIATQLKDGYNFVLGRNARAIARPRTHHNRHLRPQRCAEKGYLGLKAFEITSLTGTPRRAMQAKAKAIQAQMEDFASPPGGNPWDEALANLDQGLAAADRQARDDATRAGLDGEKGWRAAGPYVGWWITKNVLDGEGASYVGQVVGYLSAGQSDYVDAQGAAAALWHVSNVSGELGDDGEDLEEWQLLASHPRPTRPGGPEESSPGDDDAGRIGGPEESSPGDDDDAVLARVPMEKLLDTLIKRSAELHRPADQKRRDDHLLEAARALTYAATSAYFDANSGESVDQLEHGLRRPDHEIDWDVEMPGVDPRRYAGMGACQLARLSTCALDRARALADANADRVTALSKPDVEAQLEERDLSMQKPNDARLFRAFCRDMPAPAAATATAALPAGAASPSPASPVVGASEPVAAEPTVAATPAPVSSRLRSSTAPRKRKRDAIDKMTTGELKTELKKLKLDTDGKKTELQDRLLGALGLGEEDA